MIEQEQRSLSEVSFDDIAAVLELPRETLPLEFIVARVVPTCKPLWESALENVELSNGEAEIVKRCFPNGTPRRSRDDIQFINACLAHRRLQDFGKSWWHLNPENFGPTSSNAGRNARWRKRGWWGVLYNNLLALGGISDSRLMEFARLASSTDQQIPQFPNRLIEETRDVSSDFVRC